MTLLSIITALVLEQYRSLPARRWVAEPLARWFSLLDGQFNDGQYRHGVAAWLIAVGLPTALVAVVYLILFSTQTQLAFVLAVGALYLTMGFRQFSHHFTDIQLALRAGDPVRARQLLADWRGQSGDRLASSEIARISIEHALLASYRMVFAPLIWFALLGPAGAVMYRLALFADNHWQESGESASGRFGEFARRAFRFIDWLPLRLTAMGFAVTGDFEDSIFCWRTQAMTWDNAEEGILLSSGAGALGVRLGLPVQDAITVIDRPELGLGDDADADLMQSTVGLVWRTLLLCLLVMALISIASWVS